jgi:hypothetical protein
MSSKIKPRQTRLPRNEVAYGMGQTKRSGGPMRDRRDRRPKEKKTIRFFLQDQDN